MKRFGAAVAFAVTVAVWAQRAPHWMIPGVALTLALATSRRNVSMWGYGAVVAYFAVFAVTSVEGHRSFQRAVLHMPGLDCAEFNKCADGAMASSIERGVG